MFNLFSVPDKESLFILWMIFMGLMVTLLWLQWRSRYSVGLPLVYAFHFAIIHAVTGFIHSLPYYSAQNAVLIQTGVTLTTTFYGFRMATASLLSFVLGVILCSLFVKPTRDPKPFMPVREITTQLPATLLILAVLSFFVFAPVFRLIPSLGTLTTAGCSASVIGFFLFSRNAWLQKDYPKLLLSLGGTALLPIITMIFMGFAAFGMVAAAAVWTLVIVNYRPRWVALVVFTLGLFLGINFFFNWMRSREDLRVAVTEQKSLDTRIDLVTGMITDFLWLDWTQVSHLEVIDLRLNQNDAEGKAWRHLDQRRVPFANGATLKAAAVAWVPRILCPGKPVIAGGSTMVTEFTGQRFSEGTSVGAGQVFEFYVNFGWTGIFVGFVLLGWTLRWFDLRAAENLARGDCWSFARWMLPAIGLIHPGGQMSEAIGSTAAFAVYGSILHHLLFSKFYETGGGQSTGRPGRRSSLVRRRYS